MKQFIRVYGSGSVRHPGFEVVLLGKNSLNVPIFAKKSTEFAKFAFLRERNFCARLARKCNVTTNFIQPCFRQKFIFLIVIISIITLTSTVARGGAIAPPIGMSTKMQNGKNT